MGKQSDAAKLLAIGLLNYADDDGYFHADPKLVRNAIRPFDDDSGIVTVAIRDLSEIGFLEVRQHPTHGPIGFIPGFSEHQVINKRKPSKIKVLFDSGSNTGTIRDEGGPEWIRDQGSRNGSRNEGNENGKARKRPVPAASSINPDDDEQEEDEPSPEGLAFADWFRSTLDPGAKPASKWREQWAKAFDDMIRLDNRTPEEIRRVSQWARSDSFWSGNFLSPLKLRKTNRDKVQYFDVFAAAMRKAKPTPPPVVHYREKPTIIDANDPELIRRMEEAERNGEIEEIPF